MNLLFVQDDWWHDVDVPFGCVIMLWLLLCSAKVYTSPYLKGGILWKQRQSSSWKVNRYPAI